jgi:HSP20 family molecular chaperone IbpA
VTQEDIKARFENGILKLTVPKREALPRTEENHYIAIEG